MVGNSPTSYHPTVIEDIKSCRARALDICSLGTAPFSFGRVRTPYIQIFPGMPEVHVLVKELPNFSQALSIWKYIELQFGQPNGNFSRKDTWSTHRA